jgi:hypothetical protein
VSVQSSAPGPTVNLTPEEQAWLKEHKVIRLGLDIKYLYNDMGSEVTPAQAINLTAEMLAGLPPELLKDLRERTLLLDREAILEVIDRIEEHAADTAEQQRARAQNFQINRIREVLKEMEEID